ncbi:MAG: GNAT family N-acetyltransferase [Bacillota bacterium]|nr:GNAT family N-acetyltransferase [Bacillota bacterium]
MPNDSITNYEEVPRKYGDYQIDWLQPDDVKHIVELEKIWFPEPLTTSKLTELIQQPNTCYIVVRNGKQVVGYIGFQLFLAAAHTISMGVAANHRRKKLANLIQKTADAIAKKRGARWFTGEVRVSNTPQLKFLRGLGWHEIGTCKSFFGDGEDAIVVWYWL